MQKDPGDPSIQPHHHHTIPSPSLRRDSAWTFHLAVRISTPNITSLCPSWAHNLCLLEWDWVQYLSCPFGFDIGYLLCPYWIHFESSWVRLGTFCVLLGEIGSNLRCLQAQSQHEKESLDICHESSSESKRLLRPWIEHGTLRSSVSRSPNWAIEAVSGVMGQTKINEVT